MRRSWHSLALKMHLFGGLVAAVFLLLLGATGSIMAFESDIDQLLHPSLFHVTPVGKALPLGTLAGNAAAKLGPGERIGIYILPVKPDLSYGFTVFAAKKLPRQIFVDTRLEQWNALCLCVWWCRRLLVRTDGGRGGETKPESQKTPKSPLRSCFLCVRSLQAPTHALDSASLVRAR